MADEAGVYDLLIASERILNWLDIVRLDNSFIRYNTKFEFGIFCWS